MKESYSEPSHIAAKSHQSCPTLYDPTDGSPPGPAVPGILQARILEWVAISSSNPSATAVSNLSLLLPGTTPAKTASDLLTLSQIQWFSLL